MGEGEETLTVRVGLLTPSLDPAYGWARYGVDLGRALSEQGVQIAALIQSTARPPVDSGWLADVFPVLPHLVPPTRGFLPRLLRSVGRARRAAAGCDLLHVVAEPYAPLAALIAGSRPVVITAHGTYVPQTARRQIVGRLYRWAYRRAHLIAVSAYTAGQVRAALPGIDPLVIHNGVNFDQFQLPAPAPHKTGPTVLASGGVKKRKGTHLLVDALAQVRDRVPEVRLVVTGPQDDPAYLAQVQAQIGTLGLEAHVTLAGTIPNEALRGWYQHADVFALPSVNVGDRFEGFGLVFLEAGACGLPVIGTLGSGVAEAVIEGQTGLLVPQHDANALAGAVVRLLTDAALRARLGQAGRDHARQHDWAAVAGRVRALYDQILT